MKRENLHARVNPETMEKLKAKGPTIGGAATAVLEAWAAQEGEDIEQNAIWIAVRDMVAEGIKKGEI